MRRSWIALLATCACASSSRAAAPAVVPQLDEEFSNVLSFSSYSCNMTMKLACVVTLRVNTERLGEESIAVALHYYPQKSEYLGLWTPPLWVNSSVRALDIDVFRLRPATRYVVEVYGQRSSKQFASPAPLLKSTILSASTGYDFMDTMAVGTVVNGNPSFSVLMFDVESDDFKGIVMVDNEGYPVWYHDAGCQVLAFDQFADYTIVVNVRDRHCVVRPASALKSHTTPRHSRAPPPLQAFPHDGGMSSLGRVSPYGDQIDSYNQACRGPGSNWTQINHEARVTEDQQSVITVESLIARLGKDSEIKYLGNEVDYYITNSIAIWHPETGELSHEYYLDDYFNPLKNRVKGQVGLCVS